MVPHQQWVFTAPSGRYLHSRFVAIAAPSDMAFSFAYEVDGETRVRSAAVPNPQSVPG